MHDYAVSRRNFLKGTLLLPGLAGFRNFLEDDTNLSPFARDMGFFNHEAGLHLQSEDGMKWSEPRIAYKELKAYADEPPAPAHLKRYGRLERPQVLMKQDKPVYLFTAAQGGKYMTSSAFVFKLKSK